VNRARLLGGAYCLGVAAALLARRTPLSSRGPLALATDFLPFTALPLPLALAWALRAGDGGQQLALGALAGAFLALYAPRFAARAEALPAAVSAEPTHPMPGREHLDADPPGSLRVLSVNTLRDAYNAEGVSRLVLRHRPDCVAVQELSFGTYHQLAALLEDRYPHHVVWPHQAYRGLGWWSRFPLRELERAWSACGQPLALAVECCAPPSALRLVTAHPFVPAVGFGEAGWRYYDARRRDQEVGQILALADRQPPPLVLVGDFNLTEHSAAYARITRRLRDAFAERGRGFGHTFPIRVRFRGWHTWPLPLLRLDYAFHTADLAVQEARLLEPVGSDHRPLLTAFAWPAAAPP